MIFKLCWIPKCIYEILWTLINPSKNWVGKEFESFWFHITFDIGTRCASFINLFDCFTYNVASYDRWICLVTEENKLLVIGHRSGTSTASHTKSLDISRMVMAYTLWYLLSEQDVISEQGRAKISFSTWKKQSGWQNPSK